MTLTDTTPLAYTVPTSFLSRSEHHRRPRYNPLPASDLQLRNSLRKP
jgi:hypothetical protein